LAVRGRLPLPRARLARRGDRRAGRLPPASVARAALAVARALRGRLAVSHRPLLDLLDAASRRALDLGTGRDGGGGRRARARARQAPLAVLCHVPRPRRLPLIA